MTVTASRDSNLAMSGPISSSHAVADSMDPTLQKKIRLNYRRNQQQDHTAALTAAAQQFCYQDCCDRYWQDEVYSLMYGTPLWAQASESQRLVLNHLYWVAYYSQIISAEIATIYFNQTSAAGLYAHEGFSEVCEMLDLETTQERSHIRAFQTIARQTETALFETPLFSYPMRGPFSETMIFTDRSWFQQRWKRLQLQAFGLISANNTFLACQYFTIRGLRTLNGKLVQYPLSQFCGGAVETAPIPSQVSYYHFLDESYHFNSSTLISQEIIQELSPPTRLEQQIANLGLRGAQRDHAQFSIVVNGIFWCDRALYSTVYRLMRSSQFGLSHQDAIALMTECFTQPSEGLDRSYRTHQQAATAYSAYLEPLSYVWADNCKMSLMQQATPDRYLSQQKASLSRFFQQLSV